MKDVKNKGWYGKPNSIGGKLLGKKVDKARKTSGEKCRASRQVGEISAEIDAVGTTVKEKTNTWNKSCEESEKREAELYKMIELAAVDERQEHKERTMLTDLPHQLQKSRDEEDEARGLIEEMQRNLDEAQARSYEGDEGAARCLRADICLGQRVALLRLSD